MTTATHPARSAARGVATLLALVMIGAGHVEAQRPFELTPFVGAFVPLSPIADANGVEAKHQPSLALGLRGTIPSAGRIGFEGVLGLASGAVKATSASSEAEVTGRVLLASVRAVWSLGTAGETRSWHATTGLGVLSRGSDAYSPVEGTTDVGAILGIGMRTRMGRWGLRVDLEDNISSAEFGDSGSQLQNDLMLSVGLVIPLGGR